ncbi:hypothetical protein ARTHRO9V_100097 [Arthrobacter sp. 9V]|nr:hypothetical protein ARTHRO9V_100097 [Arthrobacter sp. 9V]
MWVPQLAPDDPGCFRGIGAGPRPQCGGACAYAIEFGHGLRLLAGNLVILGDCFVVADHFADDEVKEFLCERRVQVRILGESAQACNLSRFTAGISGGKLVCGLQDSHFLGGLESFREQENKRCVNVVDARPDGQQLIHDSTVHVAGQGARCRVEGIGVMGKGVVLLGHAPQSMVWGGALAGVTCRRIRGRQGIRGVCRYGTASRAEGAPLPSTSQGERRTFFTYYVARSSARQTVQPPNSER